MTSPLFGTLVKSFRRCCVDVMAERPHLALGDAYFSESYAADIVCLELRTRLAQA